MGRTKRSLLLIVTGFALGAAFVSLLLDSLFPGDRSEFPFYVWLLSLLFLPWISHACSGVMQDSQHEHVTVGDVGYFLWWGSIAALLSAVVSFAVFQMFF